LRAEFLFLVGCETQPRQMRDVFNVQLGCCHVLKLKSQA
jgi:hypothetical protein